MIFVGGISSKQKKLEFNQTIICPECGKYGRYEVFMEYTYLSLFFVPTLKWNKKFYAESTCCQSLYMISNEAGERILRGESVTLTEKDLQLVHYGRVGFSKQCPNCGFETQENFQYCPQCASPLK
jgi:RNA polymerase subunit RPABC4/transcription elongation factor Spt4